MRYKIVAVKNLKKLGAAYQALASRATGVPGMGLVHGFTGSGKSTAIAWLVVQHNGVFVRANATWTPSAMLGAILQEIGIEPRSHSANVRAQDVMRALAESRRPLFVDEADYLVSRKVMLDVLRDIYDVAQTPVMLIGMEGIEKRIGHFPRHARRITQWVEFEGLDLEDTRLLTETLGEVQIGECLLERIHAETKGSIGLVVVALARVEAYARQQGWDAITAVQWGKRALFLSRANHGALH
jgi:DNA transposition AAA+ family ATPase